MCLRYYGVDVLSHVDLSNQDHSEIPYGVDLAKHRVADAVVGVYDSLSSCIYHVLAL